MKSEEEIRNRIEELKEKRHMKIMRACVGYIENVKATIAQCTGGINALEWVLED